MSTTIAERIAELGPAQRELFEGRLKHPPATDIPLSSHRNGSSTPASATQKSMWFVHNLDSEAAVFNHTHAARIRGSLDVEALGRALRQLVERHEILRTNYRLVDGELTQIVREVPDRVLSVQDRLGASDVEISRQIEAEARRPFDLERDDMYRAVLYRLAQDDFVLVRTNHHISFDRWSAAIVNRETSELYEAETQGRPRRLEELTVQYSDFAAWQHATFTEEAIEARLQFFTSHIAGVTDSLDLVTDHPRSNAQGPAATIMKELPEEAAAAVRDLARTRGGTPFMILLAAFGLLIGRYARQSQILVGVPVALRSRPELTGLVGPLINTIVLRVDLRGNPSFAELVERVRRTSLNMIPHQDLPFDELVRATAPDRTSSRTPLFQVMFDYLNTPHAELSLAGMKMESIPLDIAAAAHDLTLYIEDRPTDIRSRWEYRSDLFERASVGGLASAYESLVRRLVAEPGKPIDEIGLLDHDDEERGRLLGSGPTRSVASLFDAIETRRREHPDAIALESGGAAITYQDLAQSARRAAEGLQEREIGPGDTVGLRLPRSIDLVTAFFGVISAGATALLLDPDQPPQRLEKMIDESKPSLIVTDGSEEDLDVGFPTATLGEISAVSADASFLPLVDLDPGDPAYVVFTSGSTGSPKGVVVGHGSLNNFVAAAEDLYDLQPTDRVLQFASPGFDTLIEELIPTLMAGATIVVRPDELFPTFEAFERFVEEGRVTVLDLPTAWWHSWVDDMSASSRKPPSGVRIVIVGGEGALADKWRTWTYLAGETRWVNSYGPSEGTVVVSTYEPPPQFRPNSGVMPIGRPIQNARLAVVDPMGHPVPPRIAGEIVIEGDPVSLGYLADAGEGSGFTTGRNGQTRYRTGDLGRLLADGTFEFLGRIDDQLKIRGTRVEPAEVAAVLRAHPAINDAIVVGRDDILAGHIVASDPSIDEAELRRFLGERLPAPMIPSEWRFHESLPLTPGGKLDRKLLESLDVGSGDREKEKSVEPRNEVEAKLTSIWEEVLGRTGISMTDSFFDLGGHSLLGVKLISRISSEMGVELPLRTIFETPTIEAIGASLEKTDD